MLLFNQMSKTIFIGTACPYVNAEPHIGHALEYVQADCYSRFQRLTGNSVFFCAGSDENSLKNVLVAEKLKIKTEKLCRQNAEKFENFKTLLNISFDIFWRTTNKKHFEGAQKIWKLCEKDIYKKKYRGLYCVGCEAFYTEDELVEGLCPEHKTKPEIIEEENYFFRLSTYEKQIKELIENDKILILPDYRKNEVLSFINQGLQDFSISRSVDRAHGWGVPVPNDPTQIMYVWFDALTYYITALGFNDNLENYQQFWEKSDERIQIIGKGIARFHAIYWVAMLSSAGLSIPTKEFIHGYVTINKEKISKSIGNVISPENVVVKYGVDATRYYLLREIPAYSDGDFSDSRFKELYNADLANNLGNLVSRLAKLSANINYVHNINTFDNKFYPEVKNQLNSFRFDEALKFIFQKITELNKFTDEKTPWKLQEKELKEFLQEAIKQLLLIAFNLKPFMPETSSKIKSLFTNEITSPISPLFRRTK